MSLQKEIDFDRALKKFKPPFEPRYVFLFSGHMIDAPGRKEPRFPADKEKIAAQAIAQKLDELDAGPKDLALCGGARGGDLLFAEACLKLGVHLQVRIPFDEPTFLKNSVTFAGENWCDRYYAVKNNKLTTLFVMPEELGPTPENADPYERDNLWQLNTAFSMGPDKVRFICLWDGKGGRRARRDKTYARYSTRTLGPSLYPRYNKIMVGRNKWAKAVKLRLRIGFFPEERPSNLSPQFCDRTNDWLVKENG